MATIEFLRRLGKIDINESNKVQEAKNDTLRMGHGQL